MCLSRGRLQTTQALMLLLLLLTACRTIHSQTTATTTATTTTVCQDIPNWTGLRGYGCEFYSTNTLDDVDDDIVSLLVDDDVDHSLCSEWGPSDWNDGYNPMLACCVCGGGTYEDVTTPEIVPSQEPSVSASPSSSAAPTQCFDVADWVDSQGDDCSWYSNDDSKCATYGDMYKSSGHTASMACCRCGGGVHVAAFASPSAAPIADSANDGKCYDDLVWRDKFGHGCDWYAVDPRARDSSGTKCLDAFGIPSGQNECCVCGGGYRDPAVPSYHPTSTPAPSSASRSSGTDPGCRDIHGWVDPLSADGCLWYEQDLSDVDASTFSLYENLGFDTCAFSSMTYNDGYSVETACCVCGGGVQTDRMIYEEQLMETPRMVEPYDNCVDYDQFQMDDGKTCSNYTTISTDRWTGLFYCETKGYVTDLAGLNANEACCV